MYDDKLLVVWFISLQMTSIESAYLNVMIKIQFKAHLNVYVLWVICYYYYFLKSLCRNKTSAAILIGKLNGREDVLNVFWRHIFETLLFVNIIYYV